MTLRIALVLLHLFFVSTVLAQEAKVRTSLGTRDDLWVGQRTVLVVELCAPGIFTGAATFDLPNEPGLMLAPPTGSPVIFSETLDGTNYTVQRHEVSVFVRRGGEQTIPPFTVHFQFKRNPLDRNPVTAALGTEPVRFMVKVPPGAENLGNVISARNLKVEDAWQPEPGKAKTGDAFIRTITYTAQDVPAMAFPPFPVDKIDGLGIYPKPSQVLDQNDRGVLIGKRTDTITYICQRAGRFVLPAVRLTWFDLDTQRLRPIDFPARIIYVIPSVVLSDPRTLTRSPAATASWQNSALLWCALIIGGFALVIRLLPVVVWQRGLARVRPVHLLPLNPQSEKTAAKRRAKSQGTA